MDVSPESLQFYWNHVKARSKTTPVGCEELSVPLGVWGDDARYNRKGEKLLLYTMNSILHTHKRCLAVIIKLQLRKVSCCLGFEISRLVMQAYCV